MSFFVNGFLTLMGNEQKDLAEKKSWIINSLLDVLVCVHYR